MAKKKNKGSGISNFIAFFKGNKILIPILCVIAFLSLIFLAKIYVCNNDSFLVKNVTINNVKGYTFENDDQRIRENYIGRNIFTINLKQAEIFIKNEFPHFKQVIVRRVFPDTVEIDIVAREPVAVIDTTSAIIIDAEGFVVDVDKKIEGITRIEGINFFFSVPKKGTTINNRNLEKALTILKGIKEILPGIKEDIDYLDVSDRRNILLSVKGVEIKMGESGFLRKLKKLQEIIQDPEMDISDMNYIDLRFEDAVISPK